MVRKPPQAVRLTTLTRPALPEVQLGIKVWADTVPEVFPVPRTEVMVLSLPELDASGLESTPLRHALISGFLRNGYMVKDAGLVSTPTLTMRRYPATETERSETVRKTEVGEDSVTETTKTVSRDDNWWWNNNGLVVSLKDPTSLWAPELLQYAALKAPYFFRIFEVKASALEITPEKLDLETTPLQVSDESYATYVRRVEEYNNRVRDQQRAVEKGEQEWREAMDEYQSYRKAYASYAQDYATNYARIIDYVNQSLEAGSRFPKTPMAEVADPPAPVPAAPSTIQPLTKDGIMQGVARADLNVRRVQMLGEVVETATGQVVWAGRIVSSGPSSMEFEELVEAALNEMVAARR